MRNIVYYVAMSLDGYISGVNDDISQFNTKGNGVTQYLKDLNDYDTVIMGRKTYEFGYKYGLKPGQKAYPHMKHVIFSDTLTFENTIEGIEISKSDLNKIKQLKEESGTDIYLCGGGTFAEWLLENQLIDQIKIKLNPFITGEGVRLFGHSKKRVSLELLRSKKYEHGLQIMTYDIRY
ncbi:dihydrofolate reductase family protein [Arcticibacterium luteifluviistationis]|uniref:Dihydrofolate reductase n=1 Tax=Arcticibacterium luteifluviistationis TaxID=1784714 RepID=A0A2Z4G885_9BACT|nr:dihydrofolate reductase family protein [Arcticibacterium luteifluviistationis]AWV97387.1 dihydrofolate reductase [Arcticibacterium luteifluviistationis]